MDKLKTLLLSLLMNTKLLLIILVILLLIIFLIFGNKIVKNISVGGSVKETTGSLAEVTQAYTSVSIYGDDTKGGSNYDTAVMQYSALVNITTTTEISKFEIKNVKLTNAIKAERAFITWPKHYEQGRDSNTFYEPMGSNSYYKDRKDEGRDFSYKVVDVAQYSDEISKTGGFVDFRYTVYGLGNKFNYEDILNNQKIYSGGKEAIYAGLKQADIESPIEFDVVITFTDKSKSVKHFKLSTDFKEVFEQGFSFKYISDNYVGQQF